MVKILVSNDDGIQANGINTLVERLAMQYDVYVVAPDRERSATGHALTLHQPLRVEEVKMGNAKVKAAYAISGTPSDCIKIALNAILEEKPDIVISGINHGPNLGADVLYSGTVSAALEGAINNYPSIAVSQLNGHEKNADFRHGAEFIANFIPAALAANLPPKTIFNVNVPSVPLTEMTGIRLTRLGVRMYTDTYEKRVDPRGQVYYWLAGEIVNDSEESDDSDVTVIRNNMISVTPVTFDMTHWDYLAKNTAYFEQLHPILENRPSQKSPQSEDAW